MGVLGGRFEPSRHLYATNGIGLRVESAVAGYADLNGCVSALSVGGATLIEIHAAPGRIQSATQDILRNPGDALCIYQRRGGAWPDTQASEYVVSSGALPAALHV